MEAALLALCSRQSATGGNDHDVTVLSCIRDYFAGVEVDLIAGKMRRAGMSAELIRIYTEDILVQAKAELTEWHDQMDEQIRAIPSGSPQGACAR